MKDSDKAILKRYVGQNSSMAIDEMQGLLLQISFAIMMVFMIAYFMFRTETKEKEEEQLLDVERQKLSIAYEAVSKEYDARYGFDTLFQDVLKRENPIAMLKDGQMVSDARVQVVLKSSFKNGKDDYTDILKLREEWISRICSLASLNYIDLAKSNVSWLDDAVNNSLRDNKDTIRSIQLSLATDLQKYWRRNGDKIKDPAVADILHRFDKASEEERMLLVLDLSNALKKYSLETLREMVGVDLIYE